MNLFKFVSKKDKTILSLKNTVKLQNKQINLLKNSNNMKDIKINKLMSDGLRNGSSLAAKYMNERKKAINCK